LPRDFSVPLLCSNIFPSYLPPLVNFCGVLAKKKKATLVTIVIFFSGGVTKEKKAMASFIVTFFCGDVDF
jgi:hypothetical protein